MKKLTLLIVGSLLVSCSLFAQATIQGYVLINGGNSHSVNPPSGYHPETTAVVLYNIFYRDGNREEIACYVSSTGFHKIDFDFSTVENIEKVKVKHIPPYIPYTVSHDTHVVEFNPFTHGIHIANFYCGPSLTPPISD